ncbi:MAG: integrase, partial [Candidatus Binatia bacterium]
MSRKSKREYLRAIYLRYRKATIAAKSQILDEFCKICGYNRKYALRLLNGPCPDRPANNYAGPRRKRKRTYGPQLISILTAIWQAAGYPWSTRLKALLPVWMPWVRKRFSLTPKIEQQLLSISPRTIDLRLKSKKIHLKKKLYGRTKPGTLLKHHIPIKTDSWDVTTPGFTEVDLVSHCGNSAAGEFIHSLNMTDIHTTWVESRAVMGKGQTRVLEA